MDFVSGSLFLVYLFLLVPQHIMLRDEPLLIVGGGACTKPREKKEAECLLAGEKSKCLVGTGKKVRTKSLPDTPHND